MEQLEEELTCAVCCCLFEDPRVLLCSHSFCRKCLEGLVEGVRAFRTPLKCPTCRKETPQNGADSLQVNYSLRAIVDKFSRIKVAPKMSACARHREHPLNIFCATDLTLICGVCATADAHRGHEFCALEEAHERETRAFGELLRRVEGWQSARAPSCLETLHADKTHALQSVSADAEKVADYFEQLVSALESKKSALLSELEALRLKVLQEHEPDISRLRAALEEQGAALRAAESVRGASDRLGFLQQMQEFRERVKVLEETPLPARKHVLLAPLVRNFDVKKWDSLRLREVDKISVPHESGEYRRGGSRVGGCRWVVLVLSLVFVALLLLLLSAAAADEDLVSKLSSQAKELTDMLMDAGQKLSCSLHGHV